MCSGQERSNRPKMIGEETEGKLHPKIGQK